MDINTPDDIDNAFTSQASNIKEPPWRDRKRVIVGTLLFCAVCIFYILWSGKDLGIYQTIAMGCFGLAGSVVAVFVGGQTYHDVNMHKIDVVGRINGGKDPNCHPDHPSILPSEGDSQ